VSSLPQGHRGHYREPDSLSRMSDVIEDQAMTAEVTATWIPRLLALLGV
jgi:hypothetical protein